MELIHRLAEQYAAKYSSPEDPLLHEIACYTEAHHPHAHMLSGHLQGQFLSLLSTILRPQRILEIGTFTGYSGLCLAKGLLKNGQLHTIELREDDAAVARANFNRSNWRDQIILHVGNALEVIPSLKEQWDLVFIDADKVNYVAYYKMVLPLVKKGGVILADNVLFHGQVLEHPVTGKSAQGIQAFNDYVQMDNSVEKVVLTIRDGLLLILKK